MNQFDETPDLRLVFTAIFLMVVIGGAVDLVMDQPETLLSVHVVFEVLMVAASLLAASYLARGWFVTTRALEETQDQVESREAERDAWRERAEASLRSLGEAISDHFGRWGLTPAERRTALHLLRGQSMKRIARETGTRERTARQQAVAVYKKSGLAGRAELAGFFLGDLELPDD